MHELGLMDATIKTVDGILAKEPDVEGVSKITLEVGELSGVIPRFLQDCWEAVADGTKYEKTELVIETVPGTARCEDCGSSFRINIETMRCPECDGNKLTPLTGTDMTIKEVEVY